MDNKNFFCRIDFKKSMSLNKLRAFAFKYGCCAIMLTALFSCVFSMALFAADVGNVDASRTGGSSGDSSGLGILISIIFSALPTPVKIILILVIIVWYIFYKGRKSKRDTVKSTSSASYVGKADLSELISNDPDFSKSEFIAYVKTVFISVQEAWEARKWETVRPFESNELFEIHNKQLQEYISKGLYPHLDKQEIRAVDIIGYEVDGKYEIITVSLFATLLNFLTDEDGKVVAGSKSTLVDCHYKLSFKRVNGVKSKELQAAVTNCPKCGAPTQITSSGQCEYCSSVITTGEYGWVLNEYAAFNS